MPATQARSGLVEIHGLEARRLLSSTMVAHPLDPTISAGSPTPGSSWYTPAELSAAYGVSNVSFGSVAGNGAGQTIAIIAAFDNPDLVDSTDPAFDTSDLHLFDAQFGLPDPPSFAKVGESGGSTAGLTPDSYWANESALDVEWAHAMAPDASILLVECNSASLDDLISGGVAYARTVPGVSVISMSFASTEASYETSYDSTFTTPSGHTGITFVAGSGDEGAPGAYPAYSPNVLAVGDTTLTLGGADNSAYVSETGYAGSGGGISQYEPKPAFQDELATPSSTFRTIPDVAFSGDDTAGAAVYDAYNGTAADPWYQEGGTSFATPNWAAMIAIADQGRAVDGLASLDGPTQTLPALYDLNAGDFHDITSGNNGFAAGSGYDLVTGRGTPIANLLLPDLAGGTGSIAGTVFNDAAGTGVRTLEDAFLSGRTVYLDRDGGSTLSSADISTTTDAEGQFTFSNLAPGTYTVRQVVPSGYAATAPAAGSYTVVVSGDQTFSGLVFGTNAGTASAAAVAISTAITSSCSSTSTAGMAVASVVPAVAARPVTLAKSPMPTVTFSPARPGSAAVPVATLFTMPSSASLSGLLQTSSDSPAEATSFWWQRVRPAFDLRATPAVSSIL